MSVHSINGERRATDADALVQRLRRAAEAVSDRNWVESPKGGFHVPSPRSYSSFFAWDSGWHVIGIGAVRPDRALRELETVFALQHASGRVPHEVRFPTLSAQDTPLRAALLWAVRGQYDAEGRSRFIDPPSYLMAAETLWNRTHDRRILDLLPAMQRCLDYLLTVRDPCGDGLVSILHPWESGTDSAPVFDAPLAITGSGWRRLLKEGLAVWRLQQQLARHRWDVGTIAHSNGFICEDVGFNGIAATGSLALANLYDVAGCSEKADACRTSARRMVDAMQRLLWDEERGFFFPRFFRMQRGTRASSNALAPLMTGLVDAAKAERALDGYLLSERHFAAQWPVAFNSRAEISRERVRFQRQALWRGPCVWISMNWIAARAAWQYGRHEVAHHITRCTAELIERSGFREFYDPESGAPAGAHSFTWPALVLDMIDTYGLD